MTFEYDVLYGLIKTVVTVFMTLVLMAVLTDFKYGKKKAAVVYIIYLISIGISSFIIIYVFSWLTLLKVFVFTISVPAIIITYMLATDNAMQAVFNYLSQINFALVLSMTATILNTWISGTRVTDMMFRIALFAVAFIVEMKFLRKPFRMAARTVKKNWGVLAMVPVVFCILIVITGLFPVHFINDKWSCIKIYIILATMITVYYVIFRSLAQSCRLQDTSRENSILSAQVSMLKTQTDILQGRDDIQRYCENHVMNGILSFYLHKAIQEGIHVKTKLDIPQELELDMMELGIVFANAIENAMELMKCVPKQHDKVLEIICLSSPKFIFEVANTYYGEISLDEDGYPVDQNENYDIKTQSIKAFINKTCGAANYISEERMFRMRILVQNL